MLSTLLKKKANKQESFVIQKLYSQTTLNLIKQKLKATGKNTKQNTAESIKLLPITGYTVFRMTQAYWT